MGKECSSVSIVIVNYNGRKLLKKCLQTLAITDYYNYDVTVVDNASTDGSVQEIKTFADSNDRIKLIQNPENLGHATGCNIGARLSNGKYIVFLDSDIEFEAINWLTELVNVMESEKSLGIAQAKIVLAEDRNCLDYECRAIDSLGTWTANFGYKQEIQNKNEEIFAASSGCCIIRREVFESIGGFDEEYFIYDDDTDLSFRARLLGYNIMYVSSAVVIHRSGILRGVSGPLLFHSTKNRFSTIIKNYELKNVIWRISLLTFFTFLISIGFSITGKQTEAKATIKGILYQLNSFPKIWQKRILLQFRRTIKDSDLEKAGLIKKDIVSTFQDFRLKLIQYKNNK